ncbi:MAG TPA: NB-ARC domain-containing protein, partial [Actinomycetota bacterium]|nr:NB-ARC domain-containing protein [Actinomycetota bacterium]
LRSLDSLPNNLPVQLTSFVGRRDQIAEVCRLMDETRILTLTGAGGCGKTRLALQVGAELLDRYPDGVWLVDLTQVSDPDLVAQAAATSLGYKQEQGRTFTETLTAHLANKTMLLLLDNCEQVVATAASLVETLLVTCPGTSVLATSREPLGVPGEVAWRVPNMSTPGESPPARLEVFTQYEAVRLFIDRARKARTGFAVTEQNAPAIAQLCHRLDGIPLAIELAAARSRVLTPQQICEGLTRRLDLLTGGARTAFPRQQTLRASIDWSHDLLSEEERILFRGLSVFAGGFTLQAADEVCLDGVLDVLAHLVDRSLVVMEEQGESARYRLLETVRHYADERLREAGEISDLRNRHLVFYVRAAEQMEARMYGPDQAEAFAYLDSERGNLAAALTWAQESGQFELGLRLASSLWLYWYSRGLWSEGLSFYESLQPGLDSVSPRLRSQVLFGLANVLRPLNRIAEALEAEEASLGAALDAGDKDVYCRALFNHAFGRALDAQLEESIRLAGEVGDAFVRAKALTLIGGRMVRAGDVPGAIERYEAAIAGARAGGDRASMHEALLFLGWTHIWRGEFEAARACLDEGLDLARGYCAMCFGGGHGMKSTLELMTGDRERARQLADAGLAVSEEFGNSVGAALCACAGASVAIADGDADRAKTLAAQAQESVTRGSMVASQARGLMASGEASMSAGDLEAARPTLEKALATAQEVGTPFWIERSLLALGRLAVIDGNVDQAESTLHQALTLQLSVEDRLGEIESVEELACIESRRGLHAEAVRLMAAAQRQREAIGFRLRWRPLENDLHPSREALAASFDEAWNEGAAMERDELIAYVQRGQGEGGVRPPAGRA